MSSDVHRNDAKLKYYFIKYYEIYKILHENYLANL